MAAPPRSPSVRAPGRGASLAIRALGLASPLGGLVPAAAAFRAGMARPFPAPDELTMAVGDDAPSPISVHALGQATFGFQGMGRLVALLAEAVGDLCTRLDLPALGKDVGTFVAMPDPAERADAFGVDPEDLPEDEGARATAAALDLLARTGEALGLDLVRGAPVQGFAGGQCAFARACAGAAASIGSQQLRGALVIAVDSMTDPVWLAELGEEGRLKIGDNPVGFAPGEGAVIAYLTSARDQGAPALGLVDAMAFGSDDWRYGDQGGPDGGALTAAAADVLSAAPTVGPPALIADNDGETWRAHELALTILRLRTQDARFAEAVIWSPAISFGNLGACAGGMALALAIRAFDRRYAPGPSFLLLSSEEQGARAVLSVGAGQS
jgi:3-oxoacyl-[acyl-carrier-protein] synthase-1